MQIAKLLFIIISGAALLGGCGGSPAATAKDARIKAAEAWVKTNAKDEDGNTPLHKAATDKDAAEAKRLIDNGADVNAKNNDHKTPLHLAAHQNAAAVAKLLIDKGADVNAKDEDGDTPLYWAAFGGAAEVLLMLIDNGAKVNAKNNRGITILTYPVNTVIKNC